MLAETDQLFAELDVTKQFRDDCLESEPSAETTVNEMEHAVLRWIGEQRGSVPMDSGETILRELKHQPDVRYVRVRRDGEQGNGNGLGRGRVWAYVGVRLK